MRPPILPKTLLTRLAAPLIAGPAEELTFDKPSEALDCMLATVSFAFDVVWEAASVAFSVVDAHLRDDLVAV